MPPASQPSLELQNSFAAQPQKTAVGPIVGAVIIVALLILGALYFWGAHLNARDNPENNLPLILGNDSAPAQ